jgi:hypothetical protein
VTPKVFQMTAEGTVGAPTCIAWSGRRRRLVLDGHPSICPWFASSSAVASSCLVAGQGGGTNIIIKDCV